MDDLTRLADKYKMTDADRTELFRIYLSATAIPDGYVAMPEEAPQEVIRALLNGQDTRQISTGYWEWMKERMARNYVVALNIIKDKK